jgi:hypothetical protein
MRVTDLSEQHAFLRIEMNVQLTESVQRAGGKGL